MRFNWPDPKQSSGQSPPSGQTNWGAAGRAHYAALISASIASTFICALGIVKAKSPTLKGQELCTIVFAMKAGTCANNEMRMKLIQQPTLLVIKKKMRVEM